MAPSRKRQKTAAAVEEKPSILTSDYRTAWLVRSEDQTVDLLAGGESLRAHRAVLAKSSEYFATRFKKPFFFAESKGVVEFDDINPKYLALFIGVAYQHSAMAPVTPPPQADNPQTRKTHPVIKDFIEVYKLCDRFICPDMAKFIERCTDVAMRDGHRAMFKDPEEPLHREMMQNFADGYEALELSHAEMKRMGVRLLDLFCGSIRYIWWAKSVDDIQDRQRFVVEVSKRMACKLGELQNSRKFTRREIRGSF